jgi:hypothetical protein
MKQNKLLMSYMKNVIVDALLKIYSRTCKDFEGNLDDKKTLYQISRGR